MNFEKVNTLEEEQAPIKLTREEYRLIADTGLPTKEQMDDPEFSKNYDGSFEMTDELKKLLESKGIELDSGTVKVEVDGKVFDMVTNSKDLGTRKLTAEEMEAADEE